MQWFRDLSIRSKILVIPAIAIISFLLYLGFNSVVNKNNSERLEKVKSIYFPGLEMTNAMIAKLERVDEKFYSAVVTAEKEAISNAEEISNELLAMMKKLSALEPEKSDQISEMRDLFENYFVLSKQLSISMIDGTSEFSNMGAQVEKKNSLREGSFQAMQDYRSRILTNFTDTVDLANKSSEDALKFGLIIGVTTLLLVVALSSGIASAVSKNIVRVAASLEDIASGNGDISRRLESNSKDEMGRLVHWFNIFVGKLHTTISEVISVISPLAQVARELNDVSSQTGESADNLSKMSSQVSNSMREMAETVAEVARYATSAASVANETDVEANEGRSIVTDTVEAMNVLASEIESTSLILSKLETDTESVGSILDVIKSIAEQTNLLALNAAIEAARAGEQGRGFAVVADEVRTLASRTQNATQEIHVVIEQLQGAAKSAVVAMEDSKERTQDAVTRVNNTGVSFGSITEKVISIRDLNNMIATATEEQSNTSLLIQENVAIMEDATKMSSQATEKMIGLTKSIDDFSKQLESVGSQFQV